MKIKKKRILKVIIPMLLIVSFLAQSVTSLALDGNDTTGGSQEGGKSNMSNTDTVGKGKWNGHYGWLISIQEIENTSGNYSDLKGFKECKVSFADKYLYDYPQVYVYDYVTNANKYAYMDYPDDKGSEILDDKDIRTANAQGVSASKPLAHTYGTKRHSSSGDNFEGSALIIEGNDNYPTIKELLENRTLTVDLLTYYGATVEYNSEAVYSFVGLWNDSGNSADRINKFLFDDSLEYYDKMIRYLDFLLIVNAMCGNAYNDYINDFCKSLNNDGSTMFVGVVMASTASIALSETSETKYIFTLPNYYAFRNKGTPEGLLHWDGTGNNDIFSTATTENTYSDVQSFYNTKAPNKSGDFMSDDYANKIWWSSGKKSALTTYPKGLYDNNPGNTGYTYFSTTDSGTPTPTEVDNPTDPNLNLEFYISVSSDDYMLTKDQTLVDATVTIDFKQSEENIRKLKLLYDSLAADTTNWETCLEVVIQRSFEYDGMNDMSGHVMDVNLTSSEVELAVADSGVYPSGVPWNDVFFRWEGTDWESAYELFTGQYKIEFIDESLYCPGLEDGEDAEVIDYGATYHCAVRFTYYPASADTNTKINDPTYSLIATGTGKYECDMSCIDGDQVQYYTLYQPVEKWAHDYAQWVRVPETVVATVTIYFSQSEGNLRHATEAA